MREYRKALGIAEKESQEERIERLLKLSTCPQKRLLCYWNLRKRELKVLDVALAPHFERALPAPNLRKRELKALLALKSADGLERISGREN